MDGLQLKAVVKLVGCLRWEGGAGAFPVLKEDIAKSGVSSDPKRIQRV